MNNHALPECNILTLEPHSNGCSVFLHTRQGVLWASLARGSESLFVEFAIMHWRIPWTSLVTLLDHPGTLLRKTKGLSRICTTSTAPGINSHVHVLWHMVDQAMWELAASEKPQHSWAANVILGGGQEKKRSVTFVTPFICHKGNSIQCHNISAGYYLEFYKNEPTHTHAHIPHFGCQEEDIHLFNTHHTSQFTHMLQPEPTEGSWFTDHRCILSLDFFFQANLPSYKDCSILRVQRDRWDEFGNDKSS